jgi:hypothetical protein
MAENGPLSASSSKDPLITVTISTENLENKTWNKEPKASGNLLKLSNYLNLLKK